jgi:cytochrome c-type biogenesis protein CcmH/NrfF
MVILLVIMVIMAIVHKRKFNQREEEFNAQLEEKINALTFEEPAPVVPEA